MTVHLVKKAVENLKQFPAKGGISKYMSTLTIITGKIFPDYNMLTLEFGTYVQIFENNDP